jgi:hypothetical protein
MSPERAQRARQLPAAAAEIDAACVLKLACRLDADADQLGMDRSIALVKPGRAAVDHGVEINLTRHAAAHQHDTPRRARRAIGARLTRGPTEIS